MPAGVQRGKAIDLIVTRHQLANPTGVSTRRPRQNHHPDRGQKRPGRWQVQGSQSKFPPTRPSAGIRSASRPAKACRTCASSASMICRQFVEQRRQSQPSHRSGDSGTRARSPARSLAEQGDYYKFTVKAGQRLSFDCQARRIGSAIDAQMYVYDAKSMRELAYDNDSPGCQTDPRISYTFKEAGEFISSKSRMCSTAAARNSSTASASAISPWRPRRSRWPPSAAAKAKIGFAGPAVEGVAPVEVDVPSDPARQRRLGRADRRRPVCTAGRCRSLSAITSEAVEQEPNNDAEAGQPRCRARRHHGALPEKRRHRFLRFRRQEGAEAGHRSAHARLFFAEPCLHVAQERQGGRDCQDQSCLAAPGRSAHRFHRGRRRRLPARSAAPEHSPLVPANRTASPIRPPAKSFELVLPSERVDVAPGGAAAIPVQVVRKGYAGPIELSINGNPNLSGKATIKAGQNAGLLLVAAKADVPMGAYQFHIVGKAMVDGQAVAQTAGARGITVCNRSTACRIRRCICKHSSPWRSRKRRRSAWRSRSIRRKAFPAARRR